VSRFDLRDISERLTRSKDTEAVIFEFLGYLQSVRPDWRASLAFYEVSRDALVNVYERAGSRLARRDLVVAVDSLPSRLVRKFFHPSAFFNASDRRTLLGHMFHSSPAYEPDTVEAPSLRALTALPNWQSCLCMPLADREDMIALLVLVSDKRGAFGGRMVSELIPVKSLAALALAQHLHRDSRPGAPAATEQVARKAAEEFQDRIRQLATQASALEQENREKSERLVALAGEIESLDKSSAHYRQELERVKGKLGALEEQSASATQHLTDAYTQLTSAQSGFEETQRTIAFLKEVGQVLAQEHDPEDFPRTLVAWFSERFGVERCSLMVLDGPRETLHIAAQRGMDPALAGRVKVRIGQGVAGWVAHNRKPLHVRVRESEVHLPHEQDDRREAYNSDSFVCVPLVNNDRLWGVLNLSNKSDGEPFDDVDLDRALIAGSLLAMVLARHDGVRRTAAWT
jgi:transcriptional regulator with GAF, ATPase, and Fis domain